MRKLSLAALMLAILLPNGNFMQARDASKQSFVCSSEVWSIDKKTVTEKLRLLIPDFPIREEVMIVNKVESYLIRAKPNTEKMLGKTALYLPIFEHYLALHGLPDFLKFLPVAESRLKPTVVSSCGAAGLWQFMPLTARHYGLRINDYVDERLAPYKATEAAVEMLAELHNEFGDWALTLAAYNCGPERVRKALKTSGCDNYWDIRYLLPRQTQKYLPYFLAAAYVGAFHQKHQLQPKKERWLEDFRVIPIYSRLSFRKISQICRLPIAYLEKLNPAYIQGIVPGSRKGYYLILPAAAVHTLKAHLQKRRHSIAASPLFPAIDIPTHYVVNAGDCLDTVAHRFQCSPQDIIDWNNLHGKTLQVHQELIVYLNKNASLGHFWSNC